MLLCPNFCLGWHVTGILAKLGVASRDPLLCRLVCQLAEAEQKLAGAESEAEKLRSLLDVERGTALTSLSQFQKQQVGAQACSADACLALNGVNACAVRHLAAGDSWPGFG